MVSPLIREKKSKNEKPDLPFPINDGGEEKQRKASRNTAGERQAAEIGDALYDKMVTFFAMLSGFLPVTSVYAVENSERAINALVNIGKRNPKVLAILAKTANGVDALELGKFVIGILVCLQVDTGRAQGDELIARAMGVTAIIDEHFGENRAYEQNDSVLMQEAPRFATA